MKLKLIISFLLFCNLANAQKLGTVSFGGNANDGNYRAVGLTGKIDLKKSISKYDFAVTSTYRWSKQSKYGGQDLVKYEDEQYLSANSSIRFGRTKLISFTENERSYQRSIDLRSSLGLGLGYWIVKDSSIELSISELVLPEYYWSRENDAYNNSTVRASTRVKFEISQGSLILSTITLFQPAVFSTRKVTFSENLIVRSSSSIDVKVSKKFSVGVIHSLSYEGYPYYINKAAQPLQQSASLVLKYGF